MPTYQYRCRACGHNLEAVQAFSDAPLSECPECGGGLRKVFSSVGVVFKGSGFYRTDSRSGPVPSESAPAEGGAGKNGAAATPAPASAGGSAGGSASGSASGSGGGSGGAAASGSGSAAASGPASSASKASSAGSTAA